MSALPVRFYARLVQLYPREFRDEFEDEMREVFEQAIVEANARGRLAFVAFCAHEFAAALLCVMHARMREMEKSIRSNDNSWCGTVAAMWLFFVFGPLTVVLGYSYPATDWQLSWWWQTSVTAFYLSSILVGLVIGWAKHWSRWSFPYLSVPLLLAGGGLANLVFRILPREVYVRSGEMQMVIIGGAIAFVTFAFLYVARAWKPLRALDARMRDDWTQMSFGMFIVAALFFAGFDHDYYPLLTPVVLLPNLFVLLGAWVSWHSSGKRVRVLSMLISLTLALSVRVADGLMFSVWLAASAAVIILIPALFEFSQARSVATFRSSRR